MVDWAFDKECAKAGKSVKCKTKVLLRHCSGKTIGTIKYPTYTAAKKACLSKGTKCFGVYDSGCNAKSSLMLCDSLKVYSVQALSVSSSSCVYVQPPKQYVVPPVPNCIPGGEGDNPLYDYCYRPTEAYAFLFNGTCAGSAASNQRNNGTGTRAECEALCSADTGCNAIEVNSCPKSKQCTGQCVLFYGNPKGTLNSTGNISTGDTKCYQRPGTGDMTRLW